MTLPRHDDDAPAEVLIGDLRGAGSGTEEEGASGRVSRGRVIWRRFRRDKVAVVALGFLVLLVLVAIFAPLVAPYPPNEQNLLIRLQRPSWDHLLGTDQFGRDQLSRLIFGARTSLVASLEAVAIGVVFGVPLGLLAGYFGGWVNAVLDRLSDALMSVPGLVLALTVVAVLGPGLSNAMIAIGVILMPRFFRITRATTQEVREETFIEASRALGCRPRRILWKHIFPNTVSPVVVQSSLTLGTAILAEASLSFLGLGVRPPTASWGSMIFTASSVFYTDSFLVVAPGVAIMLTVLAFSIVGDAARDAMGAGRDVVTGSA